MTNLKTTHQRLAIATKALKQIEDEGQTSLRWRSATRTSKREDAVEKPNVRNVATQALNEIGR